MMQKLWQKKQKLNYRKEVLDIVQYGSSVVEGKEVNDLDIAVIYSNLSVKEQLEEGQKIKKQIQKKTKIKVDIKNFDLYSFFDKGNFAKESILFYGKSLIYKNEFSRRFGLIPKLQIRYNLSKLKKKSKVKFNYLLNGKKSSYGLLRKHGGEIIAPGIVEIKPEHEDLFLKKMKDITPDLKIKRIFGQIK